MGIDSDTERRIQELCDAVDLLAPLLKEAVATMRSDVPAQAAALESGRRAVVRARNAFLADTQPIVLVTSAPVNDRGYHGHAMRADPKANSEEDLDEPEPEDLDDDELDDLADEILDDDDDDLEDLDDDEDED